jgi:hypothetical protein
MSVVIAAHIAENPSLGLATSAHAHVKCSLYTQSKRWQKIQIG